MDTVGAKYGPGIFRRALYTIAAFGLGVTALTLQPAVSSERGKLHEPVPLELIARNLSRTASNFKFSPDGRWMAFVMNTAEQVPWQGGQYSKTGVPRVGGWRTQVGVIEVRTRQMRLLGAEKSWSWAPIWSPDGQWLAFFSDEGQEAGLWVWEKATGKVERFPHAIVRPFQVQETAQWSADSRRILCKVLPAGVSLAQANGLPESSPQKAIDALFPQVKPGEVPVLVLESHVKKLSEDSSAQLPARVAYKPEDFSSAEAELAVLDLASRKRVSVETRAQVRWYAPSPQGRHIAYSVYKRSEPNSFQGMFDLVVYEEASATRRIVAENLRLSYYGDGCAWSPDSTQLACFVTGASTEANTYPRSEIAVTSLATGVTKYLTAIPSARSAEQGAPSWDAQSRGLYALGMEVKFSTDPHGLARSYELPNQIWWVEVSSGKARPVASIPGYRIDRILGSSALPALESKKSPHMWVFAAQPGQSRVGQSEASIHRISLVSGKSLRLTKSDIPSWRGASASLTSGDIAYASESLQSPPEVMMFNVKTGKTRQLTLFNEEWKRYALGEGRLLDYFDEEGRPLHGALLLPPGYRKGLRVPLIVYAFGGANDSQKIREFGMSYLPVFNMHALSTRGYAVLAPDMLLRPATRAKDVFHSVMPGVNKAIELGIVDPERLGIVGQSVGSYTTLALITQSQRFKVATIGGVNVYPDFFGGYLLSGSSQVLADPELSALSAFEGDWGNIATGGDPWTYRDRYIDNSPIVLFDRINTPLLLAQGTIDGLFTSNAIFFALKRLNKEARYLIYKDETHDLWQEPNIVDFWRQRIAFLDEYLDISRDGKGRMVFEGTSAKSRRGSGTKPSSAQPQPKN